MTVSVIVVTWNGLGVLRACLAALAQQTLRHELIVVDNGSTDGTATWLAEHAPQVRTIALERNLGFAGGNNAGIRASSGDRIVLINNDTIPPPDFLERLVAPLATDPQVGSTAGVLVFAHRPEIVASAGIVVGRDGLHRDLYMLQPIDHLPPHPIEIFGPSGGAVCFRRAALEDVGLLDERYFNYLEDADLAWRLRLRGWRCLLAPDARIRHVYSATSNHGSPFKQRLLARNRIRVLVRCLPLRFWRKHWPTIVRYDLLAIGFALLRLQPAVIGGRIEALRNLPALLGQRRRLHRRSTVRSRSLDRWIGPAVTVRDMLREQRELAAILNELR